MNKVLAAAFVSGFAMAAVGEGMTAPSNAPSKGTDAAKKVADKDDANAKGQAPDESKKEEAKKDGKKPRHKHHDHKKDG